MSYKAFCQKKLMRKHILLLLFFVLASCQSANDTAKLADNNMITSDLRVGRYENVLFLKIPVVDTRLEKRYKADNDKTLIEYVEKYHIDGSILSKGFFRNGKQDGVCKFWFKNGKPSGEYVYKYGEPDEEWREWYENGQIKSVTHYKAVSYTHLTLPTTLVV